MNEDVLGAKLRAALTAEADRVTPGDGLDGIHARLEDADPLPAEPARRRWPWLAGVAAAAAVGIIGGTSTAMNSLNNQTDPAAQPVATSSPTSSSPTATATATPTVTSTGGKSTEQPGDVLSGLPVYWLGDQNDRAFLYREFRDFTSRGNAATSAVAAMTELQPRSPGTYSPWQPASSVRVTQDGDALRVDISSDAFGKAGVSGDQAQAAVQSLVYTATAAAQSPGPVTVLIDGKPGTAWGSVAVGTPMRRKTQLQAPIWVLSPGQGATVSGTVRVSGIANVYEGNVVVEAVNAAGAVVDQGFATAAQGEFADYAVDLALPAGKYTIRAFSPDVSGGEDGSGPRVYEVTRTITVR